MGQYYQIVNLDRQERLNPHDFQDGAKLLEFGSSGHGTMAAFARLLAMTPGKKGPWAGNRVVVTGDYADEGRFTPAAWSHVTLYALARGYAPPSEELGPAPVFKALTEKDCGQLRDGDETSGWEHGKPLPAFLQPMDTTFEQPEDLFEAMDVQVQEGLMDVLEDCMRMIRCSAPGNTLAYQPLLSVRIESNESGDCTAIHAAFGERDTVGRMRPVLQKTLAFPAKLSAVLEFFEVQN